jgi:hypothetical protein
MLAPMLLLLSLGQPLPTPECRTSGLTQACGYACRAELEQVRCAQTPEGFCQRLERQLVCWDPPEEVRLHGAATLARASCRAKYRDIACGYACATSPNRIACAQTPWGVCATRFDQVHCWDPAPALIHHLPASELAGARCLQSNQGFACGWDCKSSFRNVQCAQTPRGRCALNEGRITCFDPPLPSVTHAPAATHLPSGAR